MPTITIFVENCGRDPSHCSKARNGNWKEKIKFHFSLLELINAYIKPIGYKIQYSKSNFHIETLNKEEMKFFKDTILNSIKNVGLTFKVII